MLIRNRYLRIVPIVVSALLVALFALAVALPTYITWGHDGEVITGEVTTQYFLSSLAYPAFWLLLAVPLSIQVVLVIAALKLHGPINHEHGERQFNFSSTVEAAWAAVPTAVILLLGLASSQTTKIHGELADIETALLGGGTLFTALTLILSYPYYIKALTDGRVTEKAPSAREPSGIERGSGPFESSDGSRQEVVAATVEASTAPVGREVVGHG